MGSGCNSKFRDGYFGDVTPDRKVKYTGPAIPSLNICTGDTLEEIEAVILDKLLDFTTGKGISLPSVDLSQCDVLQEFVACCSNNNSLIGIIDVLIKGICSVQANVEEVNSSLTSKLALSLNQKCLTIPNPTSLNSVLQAIIDSNCALKTAFESAFTSISTPTLSTTIINQISNDTVTKVFSQISSNGGYGLKKTGTGASQTIQLTGMVPPRCPIFYIGSLSNFDTTGKGIESAGYGGWYILNGNNNTPDMRGYVAGGATNVQGPALQSAVDPTTNLDPSYATSVGDRKGVVKQTLQSQNIPAHTHTLPDLSHTHTYQVPYVTVGVDFGSSNINIVDTSGGGGPKINMTTSNTSLGGNSTSSYGGNQPHENRQPTYYGVYIMRFD